MSIDLEQHLRLKKAVEEFKRKVAKDEGARDQILKRLKKEFGCETLEEIESELRKREKEKERIEKEYNEEIGKLKKQEWFKLVGESDE
jgi:hypothetical protein